MALPVLIAFAALALDVGYIYDYRLRMGAAADAAAISGAFEVKKNSSISQTSLESYARDDAMRNGFLHGLNDITVTVTRGTYSGGVFTAGSTSSDKFVKVVVSRPVPTFLMGILGWTSMTADQTSIAGPGDSSSGCVYALNTADPKYTTELDVAASKSGTVNINTPNCGIISNGDFSVGSGSQVKGSEIDVTASSGTIGGTVTPTPSYGVAQSEDPFIDLDEATLFGTSWTCDYTAYQINAGTVPYTHTPMVFCGTGGNVAIKIGGSTTVPVVFPSGVYILVGGGIDWKHTLIQGTAVTFYFTGTASNPYASCGGEVFSTDPPDIFQFTAPTTGDYQGLLFIQDRKQGTTSGNPSADCSSNPIKATIQPADMVVDGSIYFPNHHIGYSATTTSSGNYTLLIGGTLAFTGTAVLNSNFTTLGGVSPIKRTGIAY